MIKRIFAVIFFLCSVISIYALGKSEAQYRKELEQYPLKVVSIPISLPGTASYDFLFIGIDKILLKKPKELIEINLSTNEQKPIVLPEDFTGGRFSFSGFGSPQYDEESNSVHILFSWFNRELSPARRRSYHILHLDDYSWEIIEELSDIFGGDTFHGVFYFDSANKHIFVQQGYFILKFDLIKREFLEKIELTDSHVNIMYGNPVNLLAFTRSEQIDLGTYFFIYDISTGTRFDFPESIFNRKSDFLGGEYISLDSFLPFDENMRFLAVATMRGVSNIVLMDLNTNTIETVALDGFPYFVWNLKKIADGKYAFMVATRTLTGGHGPKFLCTLDYP